MMLTPRQTKELMKPRREFSTLPVERKARMQKGGCDYQTGGNIFDSIASGFKTTFSNPIRGLAAVSTFGASEAAIRSGQLFEKTTGVKPSKALDMALPAVGLLAPEAAFPTKAVSAGYKAIGLGKRKRKSVASRRKRKRKR